MKENHPWRTAISRKLPSAPARYLKRQKLLQGRCLDYGCGKGTDCDTLKMDGYDPYHRRVPVYGRYDTILCTFVLNVLPDVVERQNVLIAILALLKPRGIAYITVRNDRAQLNGWTENNTWQGLVTLNLPVVKRTGGWVMYRLTRK